MKHFPKSGTGADLVAICDRYTAEAIGGMEDERRDRFTTNEAEVLDPATGCSYCREALIEASRHDVPPPQFWPHADVVERSKRGEIDDALRPWATWRAAVRSYVSWQDSGASVKSSSDPSRFEAVPSGGSNVPAGDAGQRQAERLTRVGQAIAGAMPHGFAVSGGHVLGPGECQQIVVAIVCGKDVDQRTGGQGRWTKQRYRGRLPIEDEPHVPREERRPAHTILAAAVSQRVGFLVTAGHVKQIEREARDEIQGSLLARGLVLHVEVDREREAEMAIDKGKLLEGWKAIADHLGWSEKRAMSARGWTPPIPVRTLGGRVEADAQALDEWREKGAKVPEGESAA